MEKIEWHCVECDEVFTGTDDDDCPACGSDNLLTLDEFIKGANP